LNGGGITVSPGSGTAGVTEFTIGTLLSEWDTNVIGALGDLEFEYTYCLNINDRGSTTG